MTISDKNKRMIITISKEDYAKLEQIAKYNTRSVSQQVVHYVKKCMINEEKRGE